MKKNKRVIFNGAFLIIVFVLTIYGVFHGEDLGAMMDAIRSADCLLYTSFDRILCTGIILDIIGEYTEHIWMLFVKDNGNIVFDNTEFSGVCKFSGFVGSCGAGRNTCRNLGCLCLACKERKHCLLYTS